MEGPVRRTSLRDPAISSVTARPSIGPKLRYGAGERDVLSLHKNRPATTGILARAPRAAVATAANESDWYESGW